MHWNRIGRLAVVMMTGLVLTVGCRSAKTDRIRDLEAENNKLSSANQGLQDSVATEQSAKFREAEAREKAEAELRTKDIALIGLARRNGGFDSVRDQPGVTVEPNKITISSDITFRPGQATLTSQAEKTLAEVAKLVQSREFQAIRIEGHTDSDPIKKSGWESNEKLSLARAESVRKLLADHGINLTLISTVGRGASVPLVPNDTVEGKAQNRRVEIILVQP